MTPQTAPATTSRPPYRFTVDQYRRMGEAGILPEGVELLKGIIAVKGDHRNGEVRPYRFDLDQYHRMIALGILVEDDPVELIHGEVVLKMPHGDPHGLAIERLNRRLQRMLPDEFAARSQLPVVLPDSEPGPDFVICTSPEARGNVHPRPEHVFVVIEVSDTSLHDDRTTMLQLYAAARIPAYWIVNLPDRQIEVYTEPAKPRRADPHYRTRTDYKPGQDVPLVIAGTQVGVVSVDAVLP